MDIHLFNRSPVRANEPELKFEDFAMAGDDAAFTLDADFDNMGTPAKDFLLVPGIIYRPGEEALVRAGQSTFD